MPIHTKNIQFDDLDTPNITHAPTRPDYRQPLHKRSTHVNYVNPASWVLTVVYAVVLCYIAWRLINYIGLINSQVSAVDTWLVLLIKITLTCAIIVAIVLGVLYIAVLIMHRAIVYMPNDMPISILDITLNWRNDRSAYMARYTLDRYYNERMAWAQNSNLWSLQTLDCSGKATDQPRLVAAQDVPNTPLAPSQLLLGSEASTLEQLIASGLIDRSGNSLLIGFNSQKPYYIELEETGIIALAGMPRVGKSATAVSLISQLLLMPQSTIIVCDKHGKKQDALLTRLAPVTQYLDRVAIEINDIIQSIDLWYEIGSNRLAEDTTKQYPISMLVIDEFTGMILLDMLPPATIQKLLSGGVEFPKVQCHAVIIGHQWTGRLLGGNYGAPLRRATTQRIIHRIDPQDAGFLLPTSYTKQIQTLQQGAVIFAGASQPTPIELTVPYLSPIDLEYLAGVLPSRKQPKSTTVAHVAAVAAPLQSRETSCTNQYDPMPTKSSVNRSIDARFIAARMYLGKQNAQGTWAYSIRQIQALTGLRTSTIIDISRELGRSNEE